MNKRLMDNGIFVLLCLLICTDLAFAGLHILHIYTDILPRSLYSIEQDKGYAEFFQYTKQAWIILLLGIAFLKKSTLTNFSWFMVFCYVLFDDALSIHEHLGLLASSAMAFAAQLGLRAQDWGELAVAGLAGIILLTPIALAYPYAHREEKLHTLKLAGLLGLLVFFGICTDMLHIVLGGDLWGLIEDGGEMIVISLTVYYLFRHGFEYLAVAQPMAVNALEPRQEGTSADLQPVRLAPPL